MQLRPERLVSEALVFATRNIEINHQIHQLEWKYR